MSAEIVDYPVEQIADAAEPMVIEENPVDNHRKDFTSELFKIEISNTGKFGYGVCASCDYELLPVDVELQDKLGTKIDISGNEETAEGQIGPETVQN